MNPSARDQRSAKADRAVLNLLGLAARARGLVAGVDMVRRAARAGQVYRVLLAADSAEGQRGKLVPLLAASGVPHHTILDRDRLGHAIGRPPATAVGITNQDLARRLGELLEAGSTDPFTTES